MSNSCQLPSDINYNHHSKMIAYFISIGSTLLVISIISYYWIFSNKKIYRKVSQLKEPHTLPRIPFFGSLPFLPSFSEFHSFFAAKTDKEIIGFYLMDRYTIILNTREAIRDAFVKRGVDFADRPENIGLNSVLNPNHKGIFFHRYNEDFKKYHKLGLGIMKQFGFGNRIMEERILEEVQVLLNNLKKFKGEEFNPNDVLINCSINVISSVLFGQRFDENDPRLRQTISNIRNSFIGLSKFVLLGNVPLIRYIPFFKQKLEKLKDIHDRVFSDLKHQIYICEASDNSRPSLIKSYIEEEGPDYDKEQLLHFLYDLYLAGSETTASTLEWSLIYLANHPAVQEKMCKELNKIASNGEIITLNSKKNTPFCEAVLCELFRIKQVANMSVPHYSTKDSQILDYYIPSNTTVFANLYAIHHNVDLWEDPEIFRPERFMNGNGSIDESKRDILITFSLGKRSCLGEMLAKQEIFLMLVNIVNRFSVLPPSGKNKIEVKENIDILCKPTPFEVRLIEI